MKLALPVIIFKILRAAAQTTSIPSVSTITALTTAPSGVPGALIGSSFVPELGTSTTWYCPPGSTWGTVGRYAACCTDDPYQECNAAVSCQSTSLLVGPNGLFTLTCSGSSSQSVCVTGLVYDTQGTIAITNIQCWSTWQGGAWRATRAASVSAVPTTLVTSISATQSSIISASAVPGTNRILPSQTGQSSHSSGSPPAGPIVGGVIGGVALLLLALGGFLWYKRSMSRQDSSVDSKEFIESQGGSTSGDVGPSVNVPLQRFEVDGKTILPRDAEGKEVVVEVGHEPNRERMPPISREPPRNDSAVVSPMTPLRRNSVDSTALSFKSAREENGDH